jgi:hypothetical protein
LFYLRGKLDLMNEIGTKFRSAIEDFSNFPKVPTVATNYNPFVQFEDGKRLIEYQEGILRLPEYWLPLIDLFEEVLTPEIRTWVYNKIAPSMPITRESGRGWYGAKRNNGVFTCLFAERYKRDEYYARIFPVPRTIPPTSPEVILPSGKIGRPKAPKLTCSTITGCERNFKTLCCYLLNGLMEQANVKAQLVEIDIVSCHARVLCYLFPFFSVSEDMKDFRQRDTVLCLGFKCELFKNKSIVLEDQCINQQLFQLGYH